MRYFTVLFFFVSSTSFGQNTISEVLKKYNNENISYITVEDASKKSNLVFLDARELNEFNTSHIKGAIHVGFNTFNQDLILNNFNNKEIILVVYCSLGVRSEKIGEQLLKLGYKNIYNLFGGIFEWKNKGLYIVDKFEKETENVHTFSKEWAKYLIKGNKIY